MALYTIGHSTLGIDEFVAMLEAHGVDELVDVRRFPGSRRHPQFGSAALEASLANAGIAYHHAEVLGGRRAAHADSPHGAWRNASFRGYADHMDTPEFQTALNELLGAAAERNVVVMCAEAVPWRCHRNLIADAATAHGEVVHHIHTAARAEPHVLSKHAQPRPDGTVEYPAEGGSNATSQEDLFGSWRQDLL